MKPGWRPQLGHSHGLFVQALSEREGQLCDRRAIRCCSGAKSVAREPLWVKLRRSSPQLLNFDNFVHCGMA